MIKANKAQNKRKNSDVVFQTDTGADVKLVWEKTEYRAFMNKYDGLGFVEMKLGSCNAESLKKYIMEERSSG